MVRLNKNPHLRIASDVALVLEEYLKPVRPIVKQLFYKNVLPNLSLAGRLKHFHKNGKTYNKRPRHISLKKRIQNTLFESTCLRLCVKDFRNEQGTEGTCASRDRGNAEERSNISDRSHTGGVYKLAILCGGKGRSSASSYKFKESKFLCV